MAVPVLPTGSSSSSASTSSTSLPQDTFGSFPSSPGTQQSGDTNAQASSNPSRDLTKRKNKNTERGQRCMEKSIARFPEWLEEFTDNLEDKEVPASRDTPANTSQDSDSEHPAEVVSKKHSIDTHVPKHRNLEICKRTKITRAPWRKRTGAAILCAEIFGDLITADHKVLIEACESRNNHRYAVVIQDLATQWIQSHPCKKKTSQDTEKSLRKFLEPSEKPKVIYTDKLLTIGRSFEDLSWNHRTSTPHRSETCGIAE